MWRHAALVVVGAALTLPALAVEAPKVLVVTVTKGYRHDSIPTLERVLRELGEKSGAFAVDYARTDADLAAKATPAALQAYAAVVFASTSGDLPLPDKQGFLDWIAAGHGFVGVHAASDTFPGFPAYIDVVGGKFKHHGPQTTVRVKLTDPAHLCTTHLPDEFDVFDEIYQFERYDRARVHLLFATAKHPETGAPGEFPLAWTREHGRGRVFYSALGHRDDVIERGWFREHLLGGIRWAIGK